jgi:hypothetical protein
LCLVLFLCCFAGSCQNTGLQDPAKMSPEQKATGMMNVYNLQYDSYQSSVAQSNLTDVQKTVLEVKRQTLMEVWPLIRLYAWTVRNGQVPQDQLESNIKRLLGKLEGAVQ